MNIIKLDDYRPKSGPVPEGKHPGVLAELKGVIQAAEDGILTDFIIMSRTKREGEEAKTVSYWMSTGDSSYVCAGMAQHVALGIHRYIAGEGKDEV